MDKITSIQQATEYTYKKLKEINPNVEKDDVYDTIMDEILESVEFTLSDEDVQFLEDNEKNPEAIDEYLQTVIPEYQQLLRDIVADMISEELIEE